MADENFELDDDYFYDEDDSNHSDTEPDDSDDEDEDEEELVANEDEQAIIDEAQAGREKATSERILRYGADRYQNIVLNKFERTNVIKDLANEIAKGAKVPRIAGNIDGITETLLLAQIAVDASTRKSLYDIKTPEDIAIGAPTQILRDVGANYTDVWNLYELVDFEHRDRTAYKDMMADVSSISSAQFSSIN